MGGFSFKNKKKEFGGCQYNEIQFIKIKHTWLDWVQIEPWGVMTTKPITKGKNVTTQRKFRLHNKSILKRKKL
jgi:hypothetical protein